MRIQIAKEGRCLLAERVHPDIKAFTSTVLTTQLHSELHQVIWQDSVTSAPLWFHNLRITTLLMPIWWLKTQELDRCQSPAGTRSACLLYSQVSVVLPLYGEMLEEKQ